MGQMVLEVFGDILYYPDKDHLKEFPSPQDLKGRVLLSTKPPKEYLQAKDGNAATIKEDAKAAATDDAAWGKEVPDIHSQIHSATKVLLLILLASSSSYAHSRASFLPAGHTFVSFCSMTKEKMTTTPMKTKMTRRRSRKCNSI